MAQILYVYSEGKMVPQRVYQTQQKIVPGRERPELLNSGKPRVKHIGFPLLANCSRIVGEYLSNTDRRYNVETAFAGVQPITLCLAQDVKSKLASCWHLGFLPPKHQFKSLDVKADKEHLIQDYVGCFQFLRTKSSNYCPFVIDVLVVKLGSTMDDIPRALNDLRKTVGALKGYLNSVKHVVVSIEECVSCCFTFNDTIDKETRSSKAIDRQQALCQMIKDLHACWMVNHRLTASGAFAFYFNSKVKPASEMYLAKFVIPLNDPVCGTLSKQDVVDRESSKIMWVYCLKSLDDFRRIDQDSLRLCHAIHLQISFDDYLAVRTRGGRLNDTFCCPNNPLIERIVVDSQGYGFTVQLPRPIAPLADTTLPCAIVELTLKGDDNILHLTQLNNHHFPQLRHLSVVGGNITGHLSSDRVPHLKTLRIELGRRNQGGSPCVLALIHKHTQSILNAGLPWQLVASRNPGGWSLASYDIPITRNPQGEVKEESPCSLDSPPHIKDLLLVVHCQQNVDEWKAQLDGNPSLQATADALSDRLLVWSPQCVHKCTLISTRRAGNCLDFQQAIPGQTRILSSFACQDTCVLLDGATLPFLQLLKVNGTSVELSGAFPRLHTLSLEDTYLKSPWQLDAPSLQSLCCRDLRGATHLTLNPQLLPRLSSLQVVSASFFTCYSSNIVNIDDDLGLSRIKHVAFGKGITSCPFFSQFRVNAVSHLELDVSAFELPTCWLKTVWHCETLRINVHASSRDLLHEDEKPPTVMLPVLPWLKSLTVTVSECQVLLNRDMPELTECTVTSPSVFGPNLRCPALKRIRFTDRLSEGDKTRCLDKATYLAIGARPREVYFASDYALHTMAWDIAPVESTA